MAHRYSSLRSGLNSVGRREDIRERCGLEDAIRYLIGEKLFDFVRASEDDPDFAKELPAFVAEIRRLFSAATRHYRHRANAEDSQTPVRNSDHMAIESRGDLASHHCSIVRIAAAHP